MMIAAGLARRSVHVDNSLARLRDVDPLLDLLRHIQLRIHHMGSQLVSLFCLMVVDCL
jgi:hypothetical protein